MKYAQSTAPAVQSAPDGNAAGAPFIHSYDERAPDAQTRPASDQPTTVGGGPA